MSIVLKPNIFQKDEGIRKKLIKSIVEFFTEIDFPKIENKKDYIIKLLNKTSSDFVKRYLLAIYFYQYVERFLSKEKEENILRPIFLICLIDGVEENKKISEDVKTFLLRLSNKDKGYLLDNIWTLSRREGKKAYRPLYYDLIRKDNVYRDFWRDIKYEQIDKEYNSVNFYIEKLAPYLCQIRHYVLHESKPLPSTTTIDDVYGLVETFFSYKTNPERKKKQRQIFHLKTKLTATELRKIIKKGVLAKLENRARVNSIWEE